MKCKLSPYIQPEAILLPHPNILKTTSLDPQTVCDAMEAGHEEPETPDDGNREGNNIILLQNGFGLINVVCVTECSSGRDTCGSS